MYKRQLTALCGQPDAVFGQHRCDAGVDSLCSLKAVSYTHLDVYKRQAMGRRALVSSHGIHLNAAALAADVDYSDVDMVILPGGIPGTPNLAEKDRKSTRLNSSHITRSRMPSSA